jgi:hypothetical protein
VTASALLPPSPSTLAHPASMAAALTRSAQPIVRVEGLAKRFALRRPMHDVLRRPLHRQW